MDFNFSLLVLENWLVKEATLVEKAALQLALIGERQKVIERESDRSECAFVANGIGFCRRQMDTEEQQKEGKNFLTRCGIPRKFLKTVPRNEFEKLRRAHQVSTNRGVGYGVQYACIRNARARDNCPYLMLSRENEDGSLCVYYRNVHTHIVQQIRSRETRREMGTEPSSSAPSPSAPSRSAPSPSAPSPSAPSPCWCPPSRRPLSSSPPAFAAPRPSPRLLPSPLSAFRPIQMPLAAVAAQLHP